MSLKYLMSWTLKDGTRVENQLYTAEAISRQLAALEEWGATNIEIKSVKSE